MVLSFFGLSCVRLTRPEKGLEDGDEGGLERSYARRHSPGGATDGLGFGGARESGGGPPQSKTLREVSCPVRGERGMTRVA